MSNVFDTVVAFNILQFIHHWEWSTMKPLLISQTFKTVMESEEFAKQYLSRLFGLSEEEMKRLVEFGLLFGREWGKSSNNNNNNRNHHEKPKKKRKREQEELKQYIPPQTLNQILQMYTKLSNEFSIEKKKKKIIDTLNRYERGGCDRENEISEIKKYVGMVELDALIFEGFGRFVNWNLVVETVDKEFEIKKSDLLQIFGNVKEIFVIGHSENEIGNDTLTVSDIIVFTSIGYPLLMKSIFHIGVDSQSETLFIYSHKLFCNSKRGGLLGRVYSEKHDSNLLDILHDILLSRNVNEILLKENIEEEDFSDVKHSLVYDYLQCSFGSFNTTFRMDNIGFVPFVGRVKHNPFLDDSDSD